MPIKYKLRCFTRSCNFKSKEDVFRDINGHPICEDCLHEILNEYWDDDFSHHIISELKKHNKSYPRWLKWFHKNHTLCDGGEHDDYSFFYEANDYIVVIDEKNYCRYCIDEFKENEPTMIKNVDNK